MHSCHIQGMAHQAMWWTCIGVSDEVKHSNGASHSSASLPAVHCPVLSTCTLPHMEYPSRSSSQTFLSRSQGKWKCSLHPSTSKVFQHGNGSTSEHCTWHWHMALEAPATFPCLHIKSTPPEHSSLQHLAHSTHPCPALPCSHPAFPHIQCKEPNGGQTAHLNLCNALIGTTPGWLYQPTDLAAIGSKSP